MLSPYASVVEKLHKDTDKEKVTMLKIERAGDVLAGEIYRVIFSPIHCLTACLIRYQIHPLRLRNRFCCSARDKDC